MTKREIALAVVLIVGLALIVIGVALWIVPLALLVAGAGVIGLGVLFFTEAG